MQAINRRAFVGAASVAARAASPSDRVRVGFIGSGGRGRSLMGIMARYPDVEIPVISDIIEPRMEEARKMLGRGPHPQTPEAVIDYRRILDRKDIDVVVIATTQHWHGRPYIHACQAGKAIYLEKPWSLSVVEGRTMLEATKKHGVLAVMGTQQRAGAHYRKAVEIVQSGRLGKIGLVDTWNYADRGERVGRFPNTDPPPGYHWDLWLGPAPEAAFNQARLNHNWWFEYSGGILTNWGPHHFDIVLWAMQAQAAKSVVATGGKFVIDDMADTYDTLEACWEFPGFLLAYHHKSFSNFHHLQSRPRHHGIAFHGKEATMVLDRYGFEIYSNTTSQPYRLYEFPLEKPVETMEGVPYSGPRPDEKGGQDGPFQRAFLDCVKDGKKTPIDPEESHRATVLCHLAVIAYHTRRRIAWDAAAETVSGDHEAAAMLDRPRRKQYDLPKV